MSSTQSMNEQQRSGSHCRSGLINICGGFETFFSLCKNMNHDPDINCIRSIQEPEMIYYSLTLEGLPKAAVITHEKLWAASFIQLACGVTAEDIFYINLPLYHSAGFLIGMIGAIERGNESP